MRPWVAAKVVEYLDVEDGDLVDFVMQSVCEKKEPSFIKSQMEVVLDKEADNFVQQLWHFFIFHLLSLKERPQQS